MSELYDKLVNYSKTDWYPFHMPGHKRKIENIPNPYSYDITEIDGFDNLHEPEAIIHDAMEEARHFYQSDMTYFLVNGSTCGLLSAICALTPKGERILVARNCHKAVYNALFLNELNPVYIYPEYIEEFDINGGISGDKIREVLDENKEIKVIVITSPTYEGIVSDIKAIAEIAHERGAVLIVDEAHGAHFGMHEIFPKSAIQSGADVVIQSVHKTLPALTQTALLHINSDIVNTKAVERYLQIFQTSSPSYVLMSSITQCIEMAQKSMKNGVFDKYAARLTTFYQKSESLKNIKVVTRSIKEKNAVSDFDISKIVISVKDTDMTAKKLYQSLREDYHIQLEMCAGNYVIAMTSIMDTDEGFERLYEALKKTDERIEIIGNKITDKKMAKAENDNNVNSIKKHEFKICHAVVAKKISEIPDFDTEKLILDDSIGRISAEYIYLYPPGIPIAAPGEIITKDMIELIRKYKTNGLDIHGTWGKNAEFVKVVKSER